MVESAADIDMSRRGWSRRNYHSRSENFGILGKVWIIGVEIGRDSQLEKNSELK